MENFNSAYTDSEMIMENMISGAAKIWESLSAMDTPEFNIPGMNTKDNAANSSDGYKAWEPAYNTWQAFAEQVNNKDMFDNIAGERKDGFEAFQKLFQSGMEGYSLFNKKWMESAQNIGDIFKESKKKDTGKLDVFKMFNDIYQKEFSRFLSVPSLGLSREYQEKMQHVLDKSNVFNGALMEFTYFLSIPFEKSFKIVQDSLAEMAEKGSLPEDKNEYYKMWIKQLEKHYMTLFKSSEYLNALGNVVSAMSDFKAAQQLIIQDYFKMFGVPVEQDMDDLYKDIYLLKKRIKTLEKEAGQKG